MAGTNATRITQRTRTDCRLWRVIASPYDCEPCSPDPDESVPISRLLEHARAVEDFRNEHSDLVCRDPEAIVHVPRQDGCVSRADVLTLVQYRVHRWVRNYVFTL